MAAAWRLPGAEQIGGDQLAALVRARPAARACGLVNAAIVTIGLWSTAAQTSVLYWLAGTLLITSGIMLHGRSWRPRGDSRPLSRRTINRATFAAALSALPWAWLPWLYLGDVPHTAELVIITVCAGMAAGGSVLLAPVYPAAFAYVATILLPFAAQCFLKSSDGYGLLGLLALSYTAFLFAIIATTARLSVERAEALKALTQTTQLLQERDAVITTQNTRFETALNNMTQGLCFFDGEERLIVCNRHYIDMYRLDPERVRPGVTLGEVVDMRYEAGTGPYPQGPVPRVAQQGCRRRQAVRNRLQDEGRPHVCDPLPAHGGGAWVSTIDDITERQRLADELAEHHKLVEHMAKHDALTGLPNRVQFRERLDAAVANARNGQGRVAVLMLDLNRFKHVNDTLGHPVGDSLLKAVAERLLWCVRAEDTVARLGGDEFAIVVHAEEPEADAAGIAGRVEAALTALFKIDENDVNIGTSIGIAVSAMPAVEAEQLIREADVALYRAKAAGNGYRFFEAAMEQRESLLRRAAS
jgi:diguanylate cyclase (GGDEF)-like protein